MEKGQGQVDIQDGYLGRVRKDRTWVTIVLTGGRKISGRVRAFDRFTVLLESRGQEQLVFKHAIATIGSARGFSNTIDMKGRKDAEVDGKTASPSTPDRTRERS